MKQRYRRLNRIGVATAALLFIFVGTALAVTEATPEQQVVLSAENTLRNFQVDPNLTSFRDNVKKARAVLVIPSLVRAGFVFGGSGGTGVLLVRDGTTDRWSYPAFFSMGSGSFGFQAGWEKAEVVLLIMSQKGVLSLLSTAFKLGVDVSVATGPVGIGQTAQSVDVLAFSRTMGLYGGISAEGAVIRPREELDWAYYQKAVSTADIVIKNIVSNPQADPLRQIIGELGR